jgi:hypothetical protein
VRRFQSIFLLLTDGSAVNRDVVCPPGISVYIEEPSHISIAPDDDFFGPWATQLSRQKAQRYFLLSIFTEDGTDIETFFKFVRSVFVSVTEGVIGYGLDILRLWPFPLSALDEAFPEEFLPEDVLTVGFSELGEHRFRADTFGLAKIGQREVSFEFVGRELLEEAALFCGHLADWLVSTRKLVLSGQSIAFGYDEIKFVAPDGGTATAFRGWHAPLIQRLIPDHIFSGVGALRAVTVPPPVEELDTRQLQKSVPVADLTTPLRRSLDQRLMLEDCDLTGDSPHSSTLAHVRGDLGTELKSVLAWRAEPESSRDSGWRISSVDHAGKTQTTSLASIAWRVPELIRFFSMPFGSRLEWNSDGLLSLDLSHARAESDDDV